MPPAYDPLVAQQHLVWLAVSAVTAFYLHCLCTIMAGNPPTTSTSWADHEVESILQYFLANKSEIGDTGNFKKKTYAAAAEAIQGHTRTAAQVTTKWQGISHHDCQKFQVIMIDHTNNS